MRKERLKIGIPAWATGENSFGVGKAYLAHLTKYGDPVMLCPMRGVLSLDMIVLPGGADTFSGNYGAVPGYFNSAPDPYKEYFVKQNLQQYIDMGIPIWGTCLGAQQLNVFFGGKLLQHINVASHGYSDNRGDLVHALEFTPKYKDIEAYLLHPERCKIKFKKDDKKAVWTNSLHHQAIPKDGMGKGLEIIATAGICVEAFEHESLPIAAGQFHVEEDYNMLGVFLFEKLVDKALKLKNDRSNQGNQEEVVVEAGSEQSGIGGV